MNLSDLRKLALAQPNPVLRRLHKWSVRNHRTGCLEWIGCTNPAGYGVINIAGRAQLAHRVAYAIAKADAPADDSCVCHRCDNPPCIESAHFFLGDHFDNAADKISKGRMARGQDRTESKLTDDQVREIYRRAHAGELYAVIGAAFGVDHTAVYKIKHRKRWKHLRMESAT